MDDYLNEKYVDKESISSYENSDIIITLIFAMIDLIIIIISLLNLKSHNYNILKLKKKIIKLFIIDIIIRILYTRKYNKWTIYKEILLTVLNTSQFYLIISFFDEILYDSKVSKLKKSNDKAKRVKLCILFFIFTFSYEKMTYPPSVTYYFYIKINKLILLLECFIILYCIYKIYKELKIKIIEIGNNIINQSQKKKRIYLIIIGSPLSSLTLFMIYYILTLCFLFIKKPVFLIYANIVLNIIMNSAKLFTFFICEAIIYVLNEINVEKENERIKKNKRYIDEVDIFNS